MKVFKLKRTFAAVILVGGAMTAFAQQMPPIPTDPNVRIGKLENGLTYYIRHNELPIYLKAFKIIYSCATKRTQDGIFAQ